MKKIIVNVCFSLWGIYALIFGYFGLTGLGMEIAKKGIRETLCGSFGCSNAEYYGSLAWALGMIVFTFLVPLFLLIVWIKKTKKGV